MESKDIIIILVGIIGSVVATIILNNLISPNITSLIFALLGILTIFILIITYFLYKRIIEAEEKLSNTELEQKRLGEKLKIYEQLVDIRKDIEVLKEKSKN